MVNICCFFVKKGLQIAFSAKEIVSAGLNLSLIFTIWKQDLGEVESMRNKR